MNEFRPAAKPREVEASLGDEFSIIAGATMRLVDQLLFKSHERHILTTARQDANRRFVDADSFNRWSRAGRRVVYLLTNKAQDELGGLAWYRPAELLSSLPQSGPRPNHTFAMRLYRGYHNKKLALPFMAATLIDYIGVPENGVNNSNFGGVWLRVNQDNTPAVGAYTKFGYVETGNDKGRLTMVLSPKRLPYAFDAARSAGA